MEWIKKIDAIYVVNLDAREDRLLEITEHFEDYEVPFERVNATRDDNGAVGLMLTMIELFKNAMSRELENILVFEDDCKIVAGKEGFHNTMNAVMEQLPADYIMCYLGCQPTAGYTSFYSKNLLPVTGAYATHSALYSKKGIELIMNSSIKAPIDNFYVSQIQEVFGKCYMVDPFLCSQRAGVSDIGKQWIDWSLYMDSKHEQKLNEMRLR